MGQIMDLSRSTFSPFHLFLVHFWTNLILWSIVVHIRFCIFKMLKLKICRNDQRFGPPGGRKVKYKSWWRTFPTVCLTSTPSDEPGNVNESERIRYSGDQVTIFTVDKNEKTIQISSIVMLKGRCSGICLNENAKFFYSLIQKKKEIAKFKVVEQEMSTKLQPTSKAPTLHQLVSLILISTIDGWEICLFWLWVD